LNDQPLANSYTNDINAKENKYPLVLNLCDACFHLQLSHAVDPAIIYKDYAYVSGTSQTYLNYMEWFANWVGENLPGRTSILDIGCNDGSQLNYFKALGYDTYGVDPAENLHAISNQNHDVTLGFFDDDFILDERVDIIISQNSFAHNPDPLRFLENCRKNLVRGGHIIIQTSQANMIVNGEFDTIYHEHISFYNINSMNELCERAGMHLYATIKTPIHGISYIFVISDSESSPFTIQNHIAMEEAARLYNKGTYFQYAEKCKWLAQAFSDLIHTKRLDGYTCIGYGAAAKGNTFLNFSKVKLDLIVDDNPLKQGKFSPGMKIPIVSIDQMLEFLENQRDDKVLFIPLAWNFYDEIYAKIKAKRNVTSDQFVKYFPVIQVSH
jgi:SAM-dependent methyltransferase